MTEYSELPDWPRASGKPVTSAVIRSCPEDFQVDEILNFEFDGEGEHLLVHVRKRNQNTADVAQKLARHAGVKVRDIGYAGLKDRNAITTQWFSVWLPGKPDPDWSAFENDDLQILTSQRHRRKLQRGALQGNRFVIVLRDIECEGIADQQTLEQQLAVIQKQGVPNYFGEQRFGRGGKNLSEAVAMFNGRRVKARHLRSLYLSSARSFLFNEVLAARIAAGNWLQALPGEVLMLAGSRSFFVADELNEEIEQRLASGDVLPSGPLWGRGELASQQDAEILEQNTLAGQAVYRDGLETAGLKQERRALRLAVSGFQWQWLPEGKNLQLCFELPSGCYATSVLRELIHSRH
ncbi:MAG: tRNA pseudouridine(13) synthase TruD [Gammaproteobacteria bacterium]|nr:tRNA pseudouridine(13) synthase TruD [Gammaproteobacteria bacterium]MCF6260843.1 tRNA pseudouridine(13) synthase TruD [Gammaproteobacteria bacterium]